MPSLRALSSPPRRSPAAREQAPASSGRERSSQERPIRASGRLSERASRALYERYEERVRLVCLRQTGNASDALDASQETFIRVFANLGRFRGRSLSSWIHVIAVNASRDVLRKSDRRDRGSLEDLDRPGSRDREPPVGSADGSPELACARHELELAVAGALARLSAPLREVVLLRYVEGLAYGNVADALRVPLGTVKSRLSRAHEALKRRLEPKLAAHGIG